MPKFVNTIDSSLAKWANAAANAEIDYAIHVDPSNANAALQTAYSSMLIGGAVAAMVPSAAGVDAIRAPTLLCKYDAENFQLHVMANSFQRVDPAIIPPIDLVSSGYGFKEPAPPHGTLVRIEAYAEPGDARNQSVTNAETVLYSQAGDLHAGKRLSTRLVELVGAAVDQRSISGVHFALLGNFSPVADDQGVGGPNDIALTPDEAGQVAMYNAFYGSFETGTNAGPQNAEQDSYCGESRFVTAASLGDFAGTAPISQDPNLNTGTTGGGGTPSNVGPSQRRILGPFMAHPVHGGSMPVPFNVDLSRPQRVVGHIVAAPRAAGTPLARDTHEANQGPIVFDALKTRHSYASKIDPVTGAQTTECAGAISLDGAFFKSVGNGTLDDIYFDAPLEYHRRNLLPPMLSGFVPTRADLAFDPDKTHLFEGETMEGRWDREVLLPLRGPEDPTGEDFIPPDVIYGDPSGGGGGGGQGGGGNGGGGGGAGIGIGGSGSGGGVLPIFVDMQGHSKPIDEERARRYWSEARGTHGIDTAGEMDAFGFNVIPLPAIPANTEYTRDYGGTFAMLSKTRFPSPYDVDALEAFDSLPRGLRQSAFFRADKYGAPDFENFNLEHDQGMMRKRGSVAAYLHPPEVDPQKGVYPDTTTMQVNARHPNVVNAIGVPRPDTPELVRGGWRDKQDGSGDLCFDYIDDDGSVNSAKKVKVNGVEIGGALTQIEITTAATTDTAPPNSATTFNVTANITNASAEIVLPDPDDCALGNVVIAYVKAYAGIAVKVEANADANGGTFLIDDYQTDSTNIILYDSAAVPPKNAAGACYKFEFYGTGWKPCCRWSPLLNPA